MLDLNHVSMTFNPGTVNEKKALTDINLHMESGEFATIVGSNGAGKSTLFNAIAGSFIPDTGSILLDGVDMTFQPDFRRSKAIGRLFQDPLKGTAPNMTIEENLALAYLRASTHTSPFSRITKADRELFTDRLVQLGLGLENRMKQPVGLLSGGQRQALTLLMATLVTPKLLLLDEHTAALDPATADKVLELTKKIVAENHITCLMITHNMHAALELGNRTLMMDSGHIVLDISGGERANTTVDGLLDQFAKNVGRRLDNDRIRRGGAHFIAAVGIISLGDPVHQADNFRLIVCGPLFIRRFAQRFLQAGKAALLRKVQPVQPAQRVILHELVIFTNFRRIIELRHNAGNGGKNRIRAKIFQHTDTFVALLDIKAAHVLICFNGIVDALFHMGHAQGNPLAGKLSVFGQQRHKVGSKRRGAAGGFGAYHIIQRYFNGAKRYLAFGICFFQQFIQRRQIGVFACRCLFTVIAHARFLSAVVFFQGFYTLHPVPPPAVVVPSFFLILWACML